MKRPVETSGLGIRASDFSWRKSAWSVLVFACASCTLRMTSSSESAFAGFAATAGIASVAMPRASAKTFLMDIDCDMGCPNASFQSRISGGAGYTQCKLRLLMKKNLPLIALFLLVVTASSAPAAIQYEFRQTTTSDIESIPSSDCAGRAIIDGDRSRVEFLTGNAYPPGTYIIATNGSRTMTFIDPSKKTFVEVNAASVASSIGARKITIANKKIDVTKMPDETKIAGFPTEHYRMTMSYDITVAFGNLPLTQTVKTTIDKWTTNAFGEVGDTFLASGALHTGNPDLDDLVSAENTTIKGFALRQIVNVTTINNHVSAKGQSELHMNRTTTQTRELLVTSIQPTATVNVATFSIPVTYHKAGPVQDDTQKSPVHVLSMEPSGEKQ